MRATKQLLKLSPLAALCAFSLPALATNGMTLEGYGPLASAMGGAAQAVNHGASGVMQNPATLALMGEGGRLGVALTRLGPSVASTMPGMGTSKSSGTSYLMPAMAYVRRTGSLVYGLGLFAQGGMGTDYGADSFLAMGSGEPVRSELGVGRVLLPVAWQVTPQLAIGATLDYIWAGLDMRMAASGAQLGSMVTGASGNLGAAMPALGGAPWARIDFSDNDDFTGKAKSAGWAAKMGLVYKATEALTLGVSYQTKSTLKDMETGVTSASLSAAGGFADLGRITVVDFQWPSQMAIGVGWQATPALLLAADIKRLGWQSVMKDFKLRYDSAGMGGSVSFALAQNWEDQTVYSIGMAYTLSPEVTVRAGFNMGDNPIPDAYVNPLFPATVEKHYAMGAGWRFSTRSEFNISLTLAPEVKVTNGMGVEITHKQTNVKLMYGHSF